MKGEGRDLEEGEKMGVGCRQNNRGLERVRWEGDISLHGGLSVKRNVANKVHGSFYIGSIGVVETIQHRAMWPRRRQIRTPSRREGRR